MKKSIQWSDGPGTYKITFSYDERDPDNVVIEFLEKAQKYGEPPAHVIELLKEALRKAAACEDFLGKRPDLGELDGKGGKRLKPDVVQWEVKEGKLSLKEKQ